MKEPQDSNLYLTVNYIKNLYPSSSMKRGLILVLFLLAIPFVSAEISIDGPTENIYNLGDSISVSGYILRPETTLALFTLSLNCNNKLQVLARTTNLESGQKYKFLEALAIPPITGDNCTLEASLNINGNNVESKESKTFSITRDLSGVFDIEKDIIQLGDAIAIDGTVTRLNGKTINGLATIFLKQNGVNYFVDTTPVIDSQLDYSYITVSNPAGAYNIDMQVSDAYGNQFLFENVLNLEIIDKIDLTAEVDRANVNPSEKIKVSGKAETSLKRAIEVGNVELKLDEEVFETRLGKNQAYEYEIELKGDIKAGEHIINVKIEDSLGNHGETQTNFTVNQVPTDLKNTLNKVNFLPEEQLTAISQLYDQTNDIINTTVTIEIKDSEGKEVFKKVVQTGEEISYNFPQFAIPGQWTVKTSSSGLKLEEKLSVSEVVKAEVILENDIITITNMGNVDYKKPVNIKLDGQEDSVITKNPSLKPGESTKIELADEVKAGSYDVEISYDDKKDSYKNVLVAEKKLPKTALFLALLIAILLIIFSYIMIKLRRKGRNRRSLDRLEGRKRLGGLKGLRKEKKMDEEKKEGRGLFRMFD